MKKMKELEPVLKDSYIYYDGRVHVGDIDMLMLNDKPSAFLLSLECKNHQKISTMGYHVYKNVESLKNTKRCPRCFNGREA